MNSNVLYQEDINSVLRCCCDWLRFKNKTILITGATGLIGRPLVDMFILLNQQFSLGIKLLLLSRHDKESDLCFVNYITHDISLPIEIQENVDFIIHAASNTHPLQYARFPIETIMTNVLGTKNLLSIVEKNPGCRFILLTSAEIYGEDLQHLVNGFSEKDCGYLDCNKSRSCYYESKRLCETLCAAYKTEKNIDYVIARISRSYGPTLKPDDSKAMSQFLRKAYNKENIILKSEGNQFYSYVYSADVASALIFLMLEGISGEAYNVADKNSITTLKNLAESIAAISGTEVVFDLPNDLERKGFSNALRSILNTEKIEALGWHPCFNLESGITRTLQMINKI